MQEANNRSILLEIIQTLFLFACFFPFVSPVPINSDVQPLSGLFAFVLLGYNFIRNKLNILKEDLLLIFISLFFSVYINPLSTNAIDWGRLISIPFGIGIFLAFRDIKIKKVYQVLRVAIILYFIFTLALMTIPGIAFSIQNLFVRTTNVVDFTGYRGISTLSTEPGLFGGLLVALLLLWDYCYSKLTFSKTEYWIVFFMVLIMIALTKSGTGYSYFVLYSMFWFIKSKIGIFQKGIIVFCIAGLVVFAVYLADSYNLNLGRGFEILQKLSSNESFGKDTSIFYRLSFFYIGLISLYQNPFGVGFNGVEKTSTSIVRNNPDLYSFLGNEVPHFTSSFAYLTVAAGVFFLLFFLFFLVYSKSGIVSKIFAVVFISFSYSAAFPLIWVLLALKRNH